MLGKCANPLCSKTFRYLHEGKLYLINSVSYSGAWKRLSMRAGISTSPEYAWLCSVCCSLMTIRMDEESRIAVLHMNGST
jgi:hypothetical protein